MTAVAIHQGSFLMANRSRPQRVAFDVDQDTFDWLHETADEDQISTAARMRALIDMARHDPDMATRIARRVTELARRERERKGKMTAG